MPKNTYKLIPLAGDRGKQLVDGKREASEIAREIAARSGAPVIIEKVKPNA